MADIGKREMKELALLLKCYLWKEGTFDQNNRIINVDILTDFVNNELKLMPYCFTLFSRGFVIEVVII
jgi:hypothetical protein